ncbi:MAG: synthase subunit epsilon [Bacteroidota bacterium]|jgi:F-type H+-transporting ATPase subunit epsilon
MNLVILSPEKEIFTGAVKSVQAPGVDGGFQLLENHAAMVSALGKGVVNIVTEKGDKLSYSVDGGFLETLNNEVALLVSGVTQG